MYSTLCNTHVVRSVLFFRVSSVLHLLSTSAQCMSRVHFIILQELSVFASSKKWLLCSLRYIVRHFEKRSYIAYEGQGTTEKICQKGNVQAMELQVEYIF